jgi:hypothetical protein
MVSLVSLPSRKIVLVSNPIICVVAYFTFWKDGLKEVKL